MRRVKTPARQRSIVGRYWPATDGPIVRCTMNPFLAALQILALLIGSVACLVALAAVSESPLLQRRRRDRHSAPDGNAGQPADDAELAVPRVRSAG